MKRISTAIYAVLALAIAAPVATTEEGAINWSITPYMWATETTFDLTADSTPIGGGKISFSDLVDTTDTSFQIHVEGGRSGDKWSAFIDLTFLKTCRPNPSGTPGDSLAERRPARLAIPGLQIGRLWACFPPHHPNPYAGVNRTTPGQSRAGRTRGRISGFQFFRILGCESEIRENSFGCQRLGIGRRQFGTGSGSGQFRMD